MKAPTMTAITGYAKPAGDFKIYCRRGRTPLAAARKFAEKHALQKPRCVRYVQKAAGWRVLSERPL